MRSSPSMKSRSNRKKTNGPLRPVSDCEVAMALCRSPDLGMWKVAMRGRGDYSTNIRWHGESQIDRFHAFRVDRYLVQVTGLCRAAPHQAPFIFSLPNDVLYD